jgi:peptide-methionine (S)-S-oxide reductase
MERAIFAAGCFWHVEDAFARAKGVVSTRAGYTGGHTASPTYGEVCSDKTGHAEAVEIEFDPSIVSYDQLLDLFWNLHDPTTVNRQGPDLGSQYRSAVFYLTSEQKEAALRSRDRQQASGRHAGRKIVTEISQAGVFYPAEEYHQKYFQKTGRSSCSVC